MERRELLQAALGSGAALLLNGNCTLPAEASTTTGRRPRVAAIVTEYRENSHADVIVTKLLEGCKTLDLDYRPAVQVVSLFMDQLSPRDTGRATAEKHGVPIFPTIAGALTLGGENLAVDGVFLIGEHGNYPYNELGQHMYPRRRFFEETVAVFRKSGRVVPVFNDKHLAYNWADAKWMYDTARELKIPFMAGSSVPVSWRKPEYQLPEGTELVEALSVGYGGTEAYGFHALEGLQCMVERRKGGETGVRSVQYLGGDEVWNAAEKGVWSWELLLAALACSEEPTHKQLTEAQVREKSVKPEAFLVEYRDGLRASMIMPHGLATDFLFAAKLKGKEKPAAVQFWLQDGKPFGHFARLSMTVEKMMLTGTPTTPLERTLLTGGILDRAMQSRFQKGKKLETPELDFHYRIS